MISSYYSKIFASNSNLETQDTLNISNKQISYVSFSSRMMSIFIDMILLVLISNPLGSIFRKWSFYFVFSDYAVNNKMDLNNLAVIQKAISSMDFIQQVSPLQLLAFITIHFFFVISITCAYFVFFWSRFSFTPGMYITRAQILDANTLQKISVRKSIIRFVFGCLLFFGMIMVSFNKRRQALYDRITNTVLIKL